jgi:transporter family-2 protein
MHLVTFHNILLTLIALLAGSSFVVHQAVNSNLRAELSSPWWAGFFSYLGGALVMLVMIVLMREPFLSSSAITRSTWWSWSGGLFGAIYIAISILLLPRIGTFAIVVLIVIGQLGTSLAFDHFGAMNVPHYPITIARMFGAVFLVVGAILIRW